MWGEGRTGLSVDRSHLGLAHNVGGPGALSCFVVLGSECGVRGPEIRPDFPSLPISQS